MEQLQLLLNKIRNINSNTINTNTNSAYLYCGHTCTHTLPPALTATTIKMYLLIIIIKL